jgi:hypothetical protein
VGGNYKAATHHLSQRVNAYSLSGRNTYEPLDANQLYHDTDYRALPPALQIPQDGYAHGQFAYASHGSSGSLSGKRITYFITIFIPISRRLRL